MRGRCGHVEPHVEAVHALIVPSVRQPGIFLRSFADGAGHLVRSRTDASPFPESIKIGLRQHASFCGCSSTAYKCDLP
jgi:hypothetical protein